MIKKVTGAVVSLTSLALLLIGLYVFFDEIDYMDGVEFSLYFLGLVIVSSGLHFTIVSKFWTTKLSVLDSLDIENEIIKKHIEKHELLKKLDALKAEKNEK